MITVLEITDLETGDVARYYGCRPLKFPTWYSLREFWAYL